MHLPFGYEIIPTRHFNKYTDLIYHPKNGWILFTKAEDEYKIEYALYIMGIVKKDYMKIASSIYI